MSMPSGLPIMRRARTENGGANLSLHYGGVAERSNAAVSKTVIRL